MTPQSQQAQLAAATKAAAPVASVIFELRQVELTGGSGPPWFAAALRCCVRWILTRFAIMPRVELIEKGRYCIGETPIVAIAHVKLLPGESREIALPVRVLFGATDVANRIRHSMMSQLN
ncbi:MAG: hypothetical protein NT069_32205 [Planctomycetota bacterium]|nr:hypothetical protein [Planctomycetota bacterium]